MINFKLDTPINELVVQIKKDMVFNKRHAPSELCELYAEIIKYCQVHLQHAKESGEIIVPFLSKSRIGIFDGKPLKPILNFDKSQLVFDVQFNWIMNHEKKFEIYELCFSHKINFDFDLFNVDVYDFELLKKIVLLEIKAKRRCELFDIKYEYPDNLKKIAACIIP